MRQMAKAYAAGCIGWLATVAVRDFRLGSIDDHAPRSVATRGGFPLTAPVMVTPPGCRPVPDRHPSRRRPWLPSRGTGPAARPVIEGQVVTGPVTVYAPYSPPPIAHSPPPVTTVFSPVVVTTSCQLRSLRCSRRSSPATSLPSGASASPTSPAGHRDHLSAGTVTTYRPVQPFAVPPAVVAPRCRSGGPSSCDRRCTYRANPCGTSSGRSRPGPQRHHPASSARRANGRFRPRPVPLRRYLEPAAEATTHRERRIRRKILHP